VEEPFTLADLRHVYETVWGAALDPSNFRRKALDTPDFVVPLGDVARRERSGGRGRPGELYRKGTAYRLDRMIARPHVPYVPSRPLDAPTDTERREDNSQRGDGR
ncbi:MAG: hypothetical protein M3Y74_08955, partial [Chloroflexota bacterium]|nr:hypothetical protein [Chloroflexota bacterium]